MNRNPLLRTDVYKLGHMRQYRPGTTKVYSYLCARSKKNFDSTLFFGLQYYLREYLSQPITQPMADEFYQHHEQIVGPVPEDVRRKIQSLVSLGYWPLRIRAVKEGTVIKNGNVLMTITNTHPDFYWCVGFVESLLLKVWYPCTVATCSMEYMKTIRRFFEMTVDEEQYALLPFMVHDFGYRGDSSEEGAAISGAAHLVNFFGSDTVPALGFIKEYYQPFTNDPIMLSVPASEHSVMCSFGREGEIEAFRHMLKTYPQGIVSIVSDTFDVYKVLTDFCTELYGEIVGRDGKTVFRPDSGDPELVICGDPMEENGSPQWLGCIRLLDQKFGHTINSKGFKVLNEKVGLIYGDGMYLARYERILERMKDMGYAASNLVIGVGGILRNHSRDTLGFAIKATYVEVDGFGVEIEKDPVTDPGKRSHKGLIYLDRLDGEYFTVDRCGVGKEEGGMLLYVYLNGGCVSYHGIDDVRAYAKLHLPFETATPAV